jgi:hypothetical protein
MCDNCKKNIEIDETEELELASEQLKGILNETETDSPIYYTEPIIFDTENLIDDVKFNKEEFTRGIKEASYYSGMYTGYVNAGFSNIDSYNLILTDIQKNMSIEITKLNVSATIEASKNQQIMIEKNLL